MGNKVSRARWSPRIKESEKINYAGFDCIDGTHPFREAMPDAYVDYPVQKRNDGRVVYFNFEFAKEIGLIPLNHAHEINKKLEAKILDTFALQIINEYDQIKTPNISPLNLKPNKYMATRYLQLQHKDKAGRTSGDGRSIWKRMF